MEKKFELTAERKEWCGIEVFRIRALKAIERFDVKKGDLGGWVEKEENLDQSGDAWVSGNARVYGNAWVYGNARVFGDACVSGDAQVTGNALVYGNAKVFGNALVTGNARVYGDACVKGDARVKEAGDVLWFKNTWSSGRWFTYTRSNGRWAVGCFYGTGEELIRKAYADSEKSGKCYEATVRYVEALEAARKAREEARHERS